MSKLLNQRVRRGNSMQSACPGCGRLLHDEVRVSGMRSTMESEKYRVLHCSGIQSCAEAAYREMVRAPKQIKTPIRRIQ